MPNILPAAEVEAMLKLAEAAIAPRDEGGEPIMPPTPEELAALCRSHLAQGEALAAAQAGNRALRHDLDMLAEDCDRLRRELDDAKGVIR